MNIFVTQVDDSDRGRRGPCLWFWGIACDNHNYFAMEKEIEAIRPMLENSPPPTHHATLLNQMCCAYVSKKWLRAKVTQLNLQQPGVVDVCCIDIGANHSVPLHFIRIVDFPGSHADKVRNCMPLATKFILAGIIAPQAIGRQTLWNEAAIAYLKMCMENRQWNAIQQGVYDGCQCVRLFDINNQCLATTIIKRGLAVADDVFPETPSHIATLNNFASLRMSMQAFPIANELNNFSNALHPSFAPPRDYRAQFSSFTPPRDYRAQFSSFTPPSIFQQGVLHPITPKKPYTLFHLPPIGRYLIKVVNITEGPHKFYVQTSEQSDELSLLCSRLLSIPRRPLAGSSINPGTACVASYNGDKHFHRGMINKIYQSDNKCLIYFVDLGQKELISLDHIFELPDDFLAIDVLATRVSLFGAEELTNLPGVNEIFIGLVKSADSIYCEVAAEDDNQQVNLFDQAGRSFKDKILANYSKPLPITQTRILSSVTPVATCVTEISSPVVFQEEKLLVRYVEEPGFFFGQLERLSGDALSNINKELESFYSAEMKVLLYADAKSHLNHFGVVQSTEDQKFYRAMVTKEHVNDVDVKFIDYGNRIRTPRSSIFAPLDQLIRFHQARFGIYCRFEGEVNLSVPKWKELILNKSITVKIGAKIDDVYTVTLSEDTVHKELAKSITKKFSARKSPSPAPCPKLVETQPDERRKRSEETGNSGRSSSNAPRSGFNSYVHPNASSKDSKWRTSTTSQDDSAQPAQTQPSAKDSNWRAGNSGGQEVIRAPRGPPPTIEDKETKGPIGFLQLGSHGNTQPPPSVPVTVKSDAALAIVPETKTRAPPPTSLAIQKRQLSYPERQPLSGKDQLVQIVTLGDLSSFNIQFVDSLNKLRDLDERLAEVYSDKSKPAIENPKPGSPCVVQFEDDQCWYRGEILHYNHPVVQVLFVDYGNTQRSSIKVIKAIDEEFVQLPRQAFGCVLSGVGKRGAWSEEEKTLIQSYFFKEMKATFNGEVCADKHLVRLVNEGDGQRVVLNEMFGSPSSLHVSPPTKSYSILPVPAVGSPIQVNLAWFYNPKRFFTSPIDFSPYQDALDELEQYYAFLSEGELVEDQPRVDLPCVVRFLDDGRYYRSRILSMDEQIAKVLFIDYGNEQITPLKDLKRIVPRFMDFPQLIWHSMLKGVKKSSVLNPEFQKHLSACFIVGDIATVKYFPSGVDEVFEVEMSTASIGDVSEYLVRHNVLERVMICPPSQPVKFADQVAPQNMDFVLDRMITDCATVPYVESPKKFWLHLDPKSVYTLMEKLDVFTATDEFRQNTGFVPTVGHACLALAEDERWYRALIESINSKDATVHFIDYGNSSEVALSDLRPLPLEHATPPALAFKSGLDGLADVLTAEWIESFSDLVLVSNLKVKYLGAQDGGLCVRLYSTEDRDVMDLLNVDHRSNLKPIPEEQESNASPIDSLEIRASLPTEVQDESVAIKVSTSSFPATDHTQEVKNGDDDDVIKSLMQISSDFVNNYRPIEITKNMEAKVYVAYSISPNQFWVQMNDCDSVLTMIQTNLEDIYKVNVDSFRVKDNFVVGQLYGVDHPSYCYWYRGKIIKVYDDSVDILFIDYGDTQLVPKANIRHLPDSWLQLPQQAIAVSIKNSSPTENWSPSAIDKFNVTCFDQSQPCQIIFGDMGEDDVWSVESMIVGSINIFDLLQENQKTTEEEPPTPDPIDTVQASSTMVGFEDTIEDTDPPSMLHKLDDFDSDSISPLKDGLPVEGLFHSTSNSIESSEETIRSNGPPPSWNFTESLPECRSTWVEGQSMSSVASVTHVNSALAVWIQLEPSQVDELIDIIALTDVSTLPIFKPQVGRHCLAIFPDDSQWYRAVVDSVNDDHASVTYVDYGNSSEVDAAFLRHLPCQLAKLPALAIQCALEGTESQLKLMAGLSSSQCSDVICDEVLTVNFSRRTADHLFVRLFDASGVDLNEKLVLKYTPRDDAVDTDHLESTSNVNDLVNLDDIIMTSPMSINPPSLETAKPEAGNDHLSIPSSGAVHNVQTNVLNQFDILCEQLLSGEGTDALNHPASAEKVVQESEDLMELEQSTSRIVQVKSTQMSIEDQTVPTEGHQEMVDHFSRIEIRREETDGVMSIKIDLAAQHDHDVVMQDASDLKSPGENVSTESSGDETICYRPGSIDSHQGDSNIDIHQSDPDASISGAETVPDEPVAEPQVVSAATAVVWPRDEDEMASNIRSGIEIDIEVEAENEPDVPHLGSEIEVTTEQVYQQPEMDSVESGPPHIECRPAELKMSDMMESSNSFTTGNETTQEESSKLASTPSDESGVNPFEESEVMDVKIEAVSIPDPNQKPSELVYISYIYSPGDFWIQKSENEDAIGDIDTQLVELSRDDRLEFEDEPVVDQLYAVIHPEYGYWYRGQLLHINGNKAEALFVDYGDKQMITLSGIRRLPKSLLDMPRMAHHCQLGVHLDRWPQKAIDTMKKLCPAEILCTAVFRSQSSSDTIEVESLYLEESNINVVDAVIASMASYNQESMLSEPAESSSSDDQMDIHPNQLDARVFMISATIESESMDISPVFVHSRPSCDEAFVSSAD